MKKILIVTGYLKVGGGAEKVAANLGNYLSDQGYETHLLTFYEVEHKYPYHGIYHSFNERVKTNRLAKIPQIPIRIWRIYRYAKKHDIDTAYSFLEEANFYTLFAKLFFIRKLPVIASVRNNIHYRGRLFNTIAKYLYPRAEKIVAVTRAVEEILIEDFALSNTTTIYNSLDLDLVEKKRAEALPAEYQWIAEHQGPVCITIGRLTYQKAQWRMIRAFAWLLDTHPDAVLIILGEGELREALEQLVRDLGVEERVFLIGNQLNVYQFLNNADLFIFSSLFEGMPNTMLEALSLGLPIVSSDCVSGPREIIAPEIGVQETIAYPYYNQYGTLTERFGDERIFDALDATPLDQREDQFAQAISKHLASGFVKGDTYTAYQARAQDFSYYTIMQEWEGLLNTKK
ncbi:MAG: glycosyltransferase [Patescibacteria group bacterium]